MKKLAIFTLSTLVLSLFACKKTDSNSNTGNFNCKVKTLLLDNGVLTTHYYDAQGRIIKFVVKDGNSTEETLYNYSGNIVSVDDGSGVTQMYYLNSFGLADSAIYQSLPLANIKIKYTYNNVGEPIGSIMTGNLFSETINEISTMEYAGGNLIKLTDNNGTEIGTTIYSYYLDKVNKLKPFTQRLEFVYDNQNMLKKLERDDKTSNAYTYEYDSDGKVIKATQTNELSASSSEVYTWSCD